MSANPVTLVLTPAAHALLLAAVLAQGHASIEAWMLAECRAFAEAVADESDPTLNEIFQPTRQ